MKRMIKGYLQETDFTNSGAGTATWCIASKDGKKYFIKSFLEITLLDEETAKNLPAPMVEAKRKSCVQFRIRKERLYNKLNEIQNGIFISPKELLVYNGHFCAVTDYIESFEEANKIHKFTPRRKTILMRTLVLALKDLSDNHIVHSDLKPDNIIITYNQKKKPQLKIIDFDSGFFEDAPPHNVNEYHGDIVFFAPESMVFLQAEGESDIRLTCAVDKFAMGLILHQMWCGMLPEYDKKECSNVAEAFLLDKPITLHGSIPPQLQTIIKGFLQEDPDKRMNYDQAYSLLGALLETLPEDDPEVEREEESTKPPEKPKTEKTKTDVNVICVDTKDGKVIHSSTLTVAAGHELAVVPKKIDGYKCLDEKRLIRVDAHGHADHSTIKFHYKKKASKAWIWIIIAIGIILLVLSTNISMNKGRSTVSWTDSANNAPYEVAYECVGSGSVSHPSYWAGGDQASSTTYSKSFTIDYLIPGKTYIIKIYDCNNQRITKTYTIPSASTFVDGKLSASSINISLKPRYKAYGTSDSSASSISQLQASTIMSNINSKEYGFRFDIDYPQLAYSRTYFTQIAIIAPNGYTECEVHKSVDYESAYSGRYYDMIGDWTFAKMYEYNSTIPSGTWTVELYWDGMFVKSATFTVQ